MDQEYCEYMKQIRGIAAKIVDWDNISITHMYLEKHMNKEMERLFGRPVYEEHKTMLRKANGEFRFHNCSIKEIIQTLIQENNEQDELPNITVSYYSNPRSPSILLSVNDSNTLLDNNTVQKSKSVDVLKKGLPDYTTGPSYSQILKKQVSTDNCEKNKTNTKMPLLHIRSNVTAGPLTKDTNVLTDTMGSLWYKKLNCEYQNVEGRELDSEYCCKTEILT